MTLHCQIIYDHFIKAVLLVYSILTLNIFTIGLYQIVNLFQKMGIEEFNLMKKLNISEKPFTLPLEMYWLNLLRHEVNVHHFKFYYLLDTF